MCDSFDMACRDASNALHLNIKVNSENLLPNSQKYNVGSLRIPADPSWPKIPHRKLADDLDDIIEPPCVVTLTGTPRKSRTTVRSSTNHRSLSRSNYAKEQATASLHQSIYQKIPAVGQPPIKRRPGCADPRFKKVTTVKSQMTSTDSPDRERENPTESSRSAVIIPNQTECSAGNVRKTAPEKDTDPPMITQQEAEKPGEIRGIDSIGVQTTTASNNDDSMLIDRMKISSRDMDIPRKVKIIDEMKTQCLADCAENSPAIKKNDKNELENEKRDNANEENLSSNETIVSKNNSAITGQPETPCYQCCQANNNTGQLFLVVDSKTPVSSFGGVQIDGNPSQSYTAQCYNVQLPVLSYQNLPLQISTQHPQASRIDVSSQLSLTPVLTIPSTPSINSSIHHHHHHLDIARGTISRISEVPESFAKENTKESPSSDVTNPAIKIPEVKKDETSPEEAEAKRSRKMRATPTIKIPRNFRDARCCHHFLSDNTTDSEMCGNFSSKKPRASRLPSRSKETSVSGSDYDVAAPAAMTINPRDRDINEMRRKNRNQAFYQKEMDGETIFPMNRESSMDRKDMRMLGDSGKTNYHRKMKSEEHLPRSYDEKNYKNVSDSRISAREMKREMKNAGDFRREIMRKNEKLFERRDYNESEDVDSENIADRCDTHRTDFSIIPAAKTNVLPGMGGRNETTCLPVETQQLLRKSYMEYYDKLRTNDCKGEEEQQQQQARERSARQMEMGAPELKKRRGETMTDMMNIMEKKNNEKVEITTMEKLSALSNIINRKLNSSMRNINDQMQTKQLYVNENMKWLSDQITASTKQQSPIIHPPAVSSLAARQIIKDNSPDEIYDSSVVETDSQIVMNVKRKQREKHQPAEKRLLKLKTIAFFGFMMYAMIVLLPMMYAYFTYDDYEDYEDLSYVELTIDYIVSSFREAFGGLFEIIDDIFFRPVSLD